MLNHLLTSLAFNKRWSRGFSRGFLVHDPEYVFQSAPGAHCVVQGAPGAQCVVQECVFQECVSSLHRDQIFKTVE